MRNESKIAKDLAYEAMYKQLSETTGYDIEFMRYIRLRRNEFNQTKVEITHRLREISKKKREGSKVHNDPSRNGMATKRDLLNKAILFIDWANTLERMSRSVFFYIVEAEPDLILYT